jgi:hypothetical protein
MPAGWLSPFAQCVGLRCTQGQLASIVEELPSQLSLRNVAPDYTVCPLKARQKPSQNVAGRLLVRIDFEISSWLGGIPTKPNTKSGMNPNRHSGMISNTTEK